MAIGLENKIFKKKWKHTTTFNRKYIKTNVSTYLVYSILSSNYLNGSSNS